MANDLFNNPSNDYVYPSLSPCAGSGDDQYLEFIDNGLGVVQGSKILSYVDFGSIKIPVSAYSVETKILGEREVVYIPGLTKGLTLREQGFTMPMTIGDDSNNPLFMQIDFSINYYSGFKFTSQNIDVSANYDQNINIGDALNIALGNSDIKVEAIYDPSILTFKGTMDGYHFDISNVILTLIDASENASSPFTYPWVFSLEEDVSVRIPASKYPNGGMQGIVMKGIYPASTPVAPYDHWVYINHVSDSIQYYSPIEIDNYISNIRSEQINSFDPETTWGPFITDLIITVPEFICSSTGISYDPSVADIINSQLIDSSIISYSLIQECSILSSEIYYSEITTNTSNIDIISDSSIYGSEIKINISGPTLQEFLNSFISDSSISEMSFINSFIQNSGIKNSWTQDTSLTCVSIYDSSIGDTDITYSSISETFINSDNILSSIIQDSSIVNSIIKDSSLISIDIETSQLSICDISTGYIFETYAEDSYFWNSQIIDSSILRSVIDSSSFVMNSIIESTYSNAYKLITGDPSAPYIWVIDDPTLTIDDPSSRVEIQFSTINDSSLNNVLIKDSSIYDTFIMDASLIRCTLYNITTDSSSVTYEDCTTIQYNLVSDCSVAWDEDSSTFYTKEVKLVDVGRNGCSTSNIMSAGDYLQWVTDNNYWNKFGDMYIWTTAADCPQCGYSKNLIDGFYIYNPQPFDMKIEYMLFV